MHEIFEPSLSMGAQRSRNCDLTHLVYGDFKYWQELVLNAQIPTDCQSDALTDYYAQGKW